MPVDIAFLLMYFSRHISFPAMYNSSIDPLSLNPVIRDSDFRYMKDLCLEYAASIDFDLNYKELLGEMAFLNKIYNTPRGIAFILKYFGRPVGIVGITKNGDDNTAEMKRFYILPEAASAKSCRILVEASIGWAKQSRFKRIRFNPAGSTTMTRKILTGNGFRKKQLNCDDCNSSEIYFEKILVPFLISIKV